MTDQTLNLHTILARLVSFRTVTGEHDAVRECFDYIKEACQGKNLSVEEYRYKSFHNLVISTQKTLNPKIILSGHVDVVPASPRMFTLKREGSKFYGRGVYDMKFAIACYIQLLQDLGDRLNDLNFAIMLTSDEEIGGAQGAEPLLHEGFSAKVCLIPDGGDNWCIQKSSKGGWQVQLSAIGQTAHGSRPWEGSNAADKLMKALQAITSLNTNKPEGITVAISQMHAGKALNQIPSSATASLDIRFTDLPDYHEVRNNIMALAKKHGCRVKPQLFIEPVHTDLNNKYTKYFKEEVAAVLKKRPDQIDHCTSLGSSDGRFFTAHDIPVVVCRPIGGGQHSSHEWLDIVSLDQYYEVLKNFLLKHA